MSQPQQSFNFCPHCGKPVSQAPVPGQKLWCKFCGKDIAGSTSVVSAAIQAAPVHFQRGPSGPDPNEELIKRGVAARCRFCNQVVEVRGSGDDKKFVPHYGPGPKKKICISSGRRIAD